MTGRELEENSEHDIIKHGEQGTWALEKDLNDRDKIVWSQRANSNGTETWENIYAWENLWQALRENDHGISLVGKREKRQRERDIYI